MPLAAGQPTLRVRLTLELISTIYIVNTVYSVHARSRLAGEAGAVEALVEETIWSY